MPLINNINKISLGQKMTTSPKQKLDGHLQKQTWTTQKTVQMKTADFIQMIYLDIYVNN